MKSRVRIVRLLAVATICFGALFYTTGAALKPGYLQVTHFISELNATGTPWAMELGLFGFVPLGALFAAFLVAASPIAHVRGISRIGFWLLWSQPIIFIGAALAPCDAGCPIGGSPSQVAHDFLGLTTYFACALAFVLLAFSPGLTARWRVLLVVAGCMWLTLFALMLQPELAHIRGLLQRLADTLLAAVIVIVAWRMVPGAASSAPNNSFKPKPLRGSA
ncbi:DUF998 domain-containing protein [Stenotrophomonas sp. MMGLT7]|uniref:DUF998 domain-containing protein n=1 Tax=Stenotrophomonas sp. MMGLT7 TaxID=2901227 RepID=UPI001E297FA5|nr:DUF998 domain-containing protein [Stenotrophomonas sp. MMGLT7]MCD7098996.1 DUF998 domain-containing protein [Stenotrophomonas sp. MMGLT7]